MKNCPNCNKAIKEGFMKTNFLLSKSKVKFINEFHNENKSDYCNSCGTQLIEKYREELKAELKKEKSIIDDLLTHIPIVTINSPKHWDYEVKGLVTSQASLGTGLATEFASTFTDLFGSKSSRHESKIVSGEENCKKQLKLNAYQLGGNAVLAAKIEYSEIGGDKGILLVCAFGTSVKLKNLDILGDEFPELFNLLDKSMKRLNVLNRYIVI